MVHTHKTDEHYGSNLSARTIGTRLHSPSKCLEKGLDRVCYIATRWIFERIIVEARSDLPIENPVIRAMKERRSIYRFAPESASEEKVRTILEAGRWAPSWGNTQPWKFIVVKDAAKRQEIYDIVKSTLMGRAGIEGAPVLVAICVNPEKDPYHFVEDGAVAAQNMALGAHNLQLASYWIGIFDVKNAKSSAENRVKKALNIPKKLRVVALLPIGLPGYEKSMGRRWLREITYYDRYGKMSS
jgi:nitroreductase